MEDIKKELEAIKNQETQIQIRLFDAKHNRIAHQTLTVRDLIILEMFLNIKWNDLKKEGE